MCGRLHYEEWVCNKPERILPRFLIEIQEEYVQPAAVVHEPVAEIAKGKLVVWREKKMVAGGTGNYEVENANLYEKLRVMGLCVAVKTTSGRNPHESKSRIDVSYVQKRWI